MKVTSGAYQESTIGLKKDVYSFARTRFNLVTVAANSSFWLDDADAADPVASVVDMKSWLVRCFVEEEGGQNASVEAKSSSRELRSVTAIFVMAFAFKNEGRTAVSMYC